MVLHICGDTIPVMESVTETDANIISADHAFNLVKARETVGDKLTLMGNVHPIDVIRNGTPELIKSESLRCIEEAGKNGRFILAGGCELPRDVSVTNAKALVNAAKSYVY